MIKKSIAAATLITASWASSLFATTMGTVVAVGDEWVFSDAAYLGGTVVNTYAGDRPNTERLTSNLATLLGGTNYLIATTNATAYGTEFRTQLTNEEGITVTTAASETALNAALSSGSIDAVFLVGSIGTSSFTALNNFVTGGGSVTVSLGGGTPFSTGASEANAWNPFLSTYNIQAATTWTTDPALTPLSVPNGPSPLDDGVTQLLWGYGNQVSLLSTNAASSLVGGTDPNGRQVNAIAVYAPVAAVPLPAGFPLLIAAFAGLGLLRRRRLAESA